MFDSCRYPRRAFVGAAASSPITSRLSKARLLLEAWPSLQSSRLLHGKYVCADIAFDDAVPNVFVILIASLFFSMKWSICRVPPTFCSYYRVLHSPPRARVYSQRIREFEVCVGRDKSHELSREIVL